MLWGLRPVQQQAAYGIAVDRLKRQIHMGLLLPGDQFPAERKLAEDIGISRVTLREALRVLESERYIFTKRGARGGTFIAAVEVLDDIAYRLITRSPATMLRALEFRQANETTAARLACERRLLPDLKAMRNAIGDMKKAALPGEFRRSLTLFHLAIGAASHNPFINDAVEHGLAEMFLPTLGPDSEDAYEGVVPVYQQLLDAVDARQADIATASIEQLISRDRTRLHNLNKASQSVR